MYTIIGGDGKEYGPVTVQQLQAWIAAGRASLDTQAKALGTNEWKRLGDYPEFSGGGRARPLEGAGLPGERRLAGRFARLGAAIVNWLLVLVCLIPLMNPKLKTAPNLNFNSYSIYDVFNLTGNKHLLSESLPVLILTAVQVAMLSTLGQSLGKRAFRIRIIRLHGGGNPGLIHAFLLRWALPEVIQMIPFFGLVFWVADICFIFREDRRCLHDFMADTVVVSAARDPLP